MSRNIVFAVVLLALGTSAVWSDVLVYTGDKPTSVTKAYDKRTDLEKLQDEVDDLAFLLGDAYGVIAAQQQQIDSLLSVQNQNQGFIDDLQDTILIDDSSLTLFATGITLDAVKVDINAATTESDGIIECTTVITESVVSENYTPGAGNVL